ncbi:MAG: hypothetical protein RLZZ511_3812 [Cyanobacteriota bacterium]|jgi:hypothetical protein
MKQMIWRPEPQDEKVRQYFAQVNHAPYPTIVLMAIACICLMTLAVLVGSF